MRTALAPVALFVVPAVASCSFLLDFDSLQKGTAGAAGMAARAGSGGSGAAGSSSGGSSAEGGSGEGAASGSGPAGAGGNAECPAECFHDDPCLVSGCNQDGTCRTGHVSGLAPDGIDRTIPADTYYRVTLIGGDSAFYLSSFATMGGKPEVTFYALDATKKDFTTLGTLGGLAIANTGDPVSAAGLAYQPVIGVLHAFVALSERVGNRARVWHVAFGNQDNLPKPTVIGTLTAGYFASSPYNYPNALLAGSQTYAAWINDDQTISVSNGNDDVLLAIASATTRATTLALLTADDNTPAVLYTVEGGGVFLERPGLALATVSECQPAAGNYLSSSATFTTLPGVWIGAWTKFGGDQNPFLTTNGRGIACLGDTCSSDMNACPDGSTSNEVRNPATVIVHRPGDSTNLMEIVAATPLLTSDGTTITASLVLTQQNVDLGPKPLQSPATTTDLGPAILLASANTTAEASYRGPDWPAVAFVPPDRFAVAWTEPAAMGDKLRIRRYRMCAK